MAPQIKSIRIMNDSQFQKGKQEYFKYLIETKTAIEYFKLPAFLSTDIDCSNLNERNVETVLNQVLSNKQYNTQQCLYYFQIQNQVSITEVSKKVQSLKDKKETPFKLPLVNEQVVSSILYVGKTNNKFRNRLKCHLSASQPATYALHLSEWARELNLQLILHYCFLTPNNITNEILEHIETIMHKQLKPIFGRQGH